MFVKDMHSDSFFNTFSPHSAQKIDSFCVTSCCFFWLIYQLFFFFFSSFYFLFFNFPLSFPPSPSPSLFSFVFLLSSAYSANLEFLSGIGFHYLVRRPLKKYEHGHHLVFFAIFALCCELLCCMNACLHGCMHGFCRPR